MAEKKKNIKDFEHVGSIINSLLKQCRPESDRELVKVWNLWDSAVGNSIAENTMPAAFKDRLLVVHVASSTWMQHLQFFKADIIKKINDVLGGDIVEDIKFKIGPLK
jgi:predicted nucleic acid-binding Zn ribbon protein